MDTRYEDIINQLDGYTIRSNILSHTKPCLHDTETDFETKTVQILTTIYKDKAPKVIYIISLKNGKTLHTTKSLESAVMLYLGDV